MKVEKKLNKWLKADMFPVVGDLPVVFLDSGVVGSYTPPGKPPKETFEISVSLNPDVSLNPEVQCSWSVNDTSFDTLIDLFGCDTDQWVGKTASLYLVDAVVGGVPRKVIYAREKPSV